MGKKGPTKKGLRFFFFFNEFCALCTRILPDLPVGASTCGLESSRPGFKIFCNPGAWDESFLFPAAHGAKSHCALGGSCGD